MLTHTHHALWFNARPTLLPLIMVLALASGHPASAALLLTEIHYNGPTAGSDPDEFLELSNNSPAQLSLAGYRFTSGVALAFGAGVELPAWQSLVLVRDSLGFGASFPAVTARLLEFGGALSNSGETLTLSNSTVVWNNADVGGGIFNEGPLALTDSTVWGNVAFQGGGITNQSRTLTVTNSTVSLNTARYGGGIENQADGLLTLTNSTVSGNAAPNGGGIYNVDGGELTASGTLINNDCLGDPALPGGHNIESPGDTCGFDQGTDLVNVSVDDLKLGPLQDNGGPTQTHALLPGSVAIDHIPAADCEVDEDQRGELRPGGAMCDAGAFEVQP